LAIAIPLSFADGSKPKSEWGQASRINAATLGEKAGEEPGVEERKEGAKLVRNCVARRSEK